MIAQFLVDALPLGALVVNQALDLVHLNGLWAGRRGRVARQLGRPVVVYRPHTEHQQKAGA
jgi:hypothetical protein